MGAAVGIRIWRHLLDPPSSKLPTKSDDSSLDPPGPTKHHSLADNQAESELIDWSDIAQA